MTTVSAVMRRPYSPGMFDDLDLPAHERDYDAATDVTTLVFDAALDDAEVTAVWCRMESADDDDQARRSTLRALVAAAENTDLDAVGQLAVAAMHYWLGDTEEMS